MTPRKLPKRKHRAPTPRISSTLTNKEALFAREYLVDFNTTQAAIRSGYSKKSAHVIGWELLRKPRVSGELQRLLDQRAKDAEFRGITSEQVLEEIRRLGFSDLRGCFDENNRLLEPKDWPDHVAAAISSVEIVREKVRKDGDVTVEESVLKVRTWDKPKALELLGRYLKLLTDNINLKGDVTVSSPVSEDAAKKLPTAVLQAARAKFDEAIALMSGASKG